MITIRSAAAMVAALVLASGASSASAFELDGAWASAPENCAKVFARKGSKFAFSDNPDVYGGGFIVDGDHIVGKAGRCRIKTRKDDGKRIHLIAECASDIMFQNMQFNLAVVDPNTVAQIFPGVDDMQMSFARCAAQ